MTLRARATCILLLLAFSALPILVSAQNTDSLFDQFVGRGARGQGNNDQDSESQRHSRIAPSPTPVGNEPARETEDAPEPDPTSTPRPTATSRPRPSNTPTPEPEPAATDTPPPTETPTAAPTTADTETPTPPAAPEATETPIATDTPAPPPTDTPFPAPTKPLALPAETAPPTPTPAMRLGTGDFSTEPSDAFAAPEPQSRAQGLLSAEARLQPSRKVYPPGGEVVYEITVNWRGDPGEISVLFPDTIETLNLEPVGTKKADKPARTSPGRSSQICRYTFRPLTGGLASVGPSSVGIRRGAGRDLTASDKVSQVLPVNRLDITVGDEAVREWSRTALRIGIALAVVLLLWWLLTVVFSLVNRRKYAVAGAEDDHTSADERLLSELTTLQLVLIRTNVQGYYEKAFGLLRRVLFSRHIIDQSHEEPEEVLQELRRREVDPTYIDCVESIIRRCQDVWQRIETPDATANEKIIKDLRTLIRMRPHLSPTRDAETEARSGEETGEKPGDESKETPGSSRRPPTAR